jgi:polar amino acid transport system substrate-binding protein
MYCDYIIEKFFIILLVFCFHDEVQAEENIEVATEIWPPYNYLENDILIGTSTKIVEASLKRENIPFDITIYPWTRAYELAKNKKNILIYTIMRIPEREALFQWIRPLGESDTVYLYQSSARTDIKISSLKDAKKYRIAVVRGDMKHNFLLGQGFDDSSLYLVSRQEQGVQMLLHKRADFILFSDTNISMNLNPSMYQKIGSRKLFPYLIQRLIWHLEIPHQLKWWIKSVKLMMNL